MKRKWWIAPALVLILILSGCVQGNVGVKINKDGSGETSFRIGVDENASGRFADRTDGLVETAKAELTQRGYEVSDYTSGGYTGFEASKSFEDIQEMDVLPASGVVSDGAQDIPVDTTVEEGFFTRTYAIVADVDLGESVSIPGAARFIGDRIDLTFTLDLPVKPKSHNADDVDGNVLTWNLDALEENRIMVEITVPNIKNIAITAGAAIVLIVLFFVFLRRRKRLSR
ncbi:DUF3153 domain-containing protein [Bacillus sp. SB49]|uniref:LppM family (lipo)protein n=1 Tax=Bacillus sp. SB49 TaxID=1071080 RepID=UPI00040334C7|nr:DUF3153 domain-containing protein [Bacillus sp. SB49]QHT48462.1 DUF3153 domain-containing protein [Bacillus sp. SB49]